MKMIKLLDFAQNLQLGKDSILQVNKLLETVSKIFHTLISRMKDYFKSNELNKILLGNKIYDFLETKILPLYYEKFGFSEKFDLFSELKQDFSIYLTNISLKYNNSNKKPDQNTYSADLCYLKMIEKHTIVLSDMAKDIIEKLLQQINDINEVKKLIDALSQNNEFGGLILKGDKFKLILMGMMSGEKSNHDHELLCNNKNVSIHVREIYENLPKTIYDKEKLKNGLEELKHELNINTYVQKAGKIKFTNNMGIEAVELFVRSTIIWSLVNFDKIYYGEGLLPLLWQPSIDQIKILEILFKAKNSMLSNKILPLSDVNKNNSISLANLAVVFAIFGFEVHVACLTLEKAHEEFRSHSNLFYELDLERFIIFGSIESLILENPKTLQEASINQRPKVLLVNEFSILLQESIVDRIESSSHEMQFINIFKRYINVFGFTKFRNYFSANEIKNIKVNFDIELVGDYRGNPFKISQISTKYSEKWKFYSTIQNLFENLIFDGDSQNEVIIVISFKSDESVLDFFDSQTFEKYRNICECITSTISKEEIRRITKLCSFGRPIYLVNSNSSNFMDLLGSIPYETHLIVTWIPECKWEFLLKFQQLETMLDKHLKAYFIMGNSVNQELETEELENFIKKVYK